MLNLCLIDDSLDHDVPLVEMGLSQLQASHQLLKKGGGSASCLLSLEYYNRSISSWEPIVEPWRWLALGIIIIHQHPIHLVHTHNTRSVSGPVLRVSCHIHWCSTRVSSEPVIRILTQSLFVSVWHSTLWFHVWVSLKSNQDLLTSPLHGAVIGYDTRYKGL